MAAAEPQATGMGFLGLLSFRRSPTAVASLDLAQEDELHELDHFQAHVADRLLALTAQPPAHAQAQTHLLSLAFLAKLMDMVLSSDSCFRDLLAVVPSATALSRAPADRLAADLLDRAVKSLDLLNAASLALASLRGSHRAARTAASCLLSRPLHPAQLARARRAICRLFPDVAGGAPNKLSSFCRTGSGGSGHAAHARTLSFSVSKNWSAGRQVHAMAAHLTPPALAAAGSGLGLALYTMSSVLVFAMWALVAAVPCQDRSSTATTPPVSPPKQVQWAAPMVALQERIGEEWRRKEKKGSSGSAGAASPAMTGLLAEMQAVERAARSLLRFLDELAEEEEETAMAMGEQRARDVGERAEELAAACRALEDGLGPLERQVRAVFHRVVASRAEVMRCIEHSARCANANASAAAAASASGMPPHHSF